MEFWAPVLTLTGLGLFFSLVLFWASQKFSVVQDPRIREILERLPGANCGACGMAGCSNFAEGLLKKETKLSNCKACSEEDACKIAAILGVEFSHGDKKAVILRCAGGSKAKDKFIYEGLKDCLAVARTLGGHKLCSYACLGFGACVKACAFGAIHIGPEGLPVIDSDLCTGCGKCISVCPRNLLVLISVKNKVYIGCSSLDFAKSVVSSCSVGCIACRKCEQECPFGAIKIVENLAVIDYDKCTSCGKCVKVCPRKVIFRRK